MWDTVDSIKAGGHKVMDNFLKVSRSEEQTTGPEFLFNMFVSLPLRLERVQKQQYNHICCSSRDLQGR